VGRADHGEEEVRGMDGVALGGGGGLADRGVGSTVLVVEDEALLALEFEQTLVEAGWDVLLAANGREALGLAATHGERLRAAIVNLGLPFGMSGQDVVRGLRDLRPGLPVVVVTGHRPAWPEADLRGLGGPTARAIKPLAPDGLLRRLMEVLDRDGAG
jgi:DNA-binding response OmpR family regulator